MSYFLPYLLLLFILFVITRTFTVLLHELGHAIPAILFTREKVTVYVGSYGDPKKSLKLKLGLLEVYFKYNLFYWNVGLCVPSAKHISVNKQIIYILAGPITSFIIAFFSCYYSFAYDMHGFLKLVLIIFLGSAIFDLIVNLIPLSTSIVLYDGTSTYNDGYNLKTLFYYKRLPAEYAEAAELYNEGSFDKAATIFESILSKRKKDEHVYRLTISCYQQSKNYEKTRDLFEDFAKKGKMTADDFTNLGYIYGQLGLQEKSIMAYTTSLEKNGNNKYALNNKGYAFTLQEKYEEAIILLDKAIEIDNEFAFAFNNRGFAKVKTGKHEEGLADINRSMELDKDNSYVYRNLGVYYLAKKEYSKALQNLYKAKEIDKTTELIEELISEAKSFELA